MSATSAPEAEARQTLAGVSRNDHDHETNAPQSPPSTESAPTQQPGNHGLPAPPPVSAAADAADHLPQAVKTEECFLTPAPAAEADDTTAATTLRPAPTPSAKRRESEAELVASDLNEIRPLKKRKRSSSPPWRLPIAQVSTLKTADGRRVSARHNTATPGASETESRGRSGSQSLSRSRAASPPWKKFEAEGPTTIQVDGKRKSGRVNKDQPEHPKRVSPRIKKQVDKFSTPSKQHDAKKTFGTRASMSRGNKKHDLEGENQLNRDDRPSSSTTNAKKIAKLRAQIAALEPSRSFSSPDESTPRSNHKRKQSRDVQVGRPLSPPLSRKLRQSSNTEQSPPKMKPSPRIKLRFGTPRNMINPPHPQARMASPPRPPQLSLHQIIEEYELKEMQLPYTENDRGPPDQEFFVQRAIKQAAEEGAMRKRLLEAAGSGGPLSRERLSLYQDDSQPEPPQQYSHTDHLVSHALFLRTLQLREKTQHRLLAKKLAHEALDKWKLKNGPTEEDQIAEQNRINELVKKQVVADLKAMWERVEAHVQEVRKRAWEQEQEQIRAKKLQEKLEFSESLLARQRGEPDSDVEMDEASSADDHDSDVASEEDDSEAENMSESGNESAASNEEEEEEEGEMDKDALAAYLAQRAAEPPDKQSERDTQDPRGTAGNITSTDATTPMDGATEVESESTSDESTEMYDSDEDMSSTGDEANENNDDEDDDSDDDSDGDTGPPGMRDTLLGFYSTKQLLHERDGGLPTPMTSVENGGDNDNPNPDSRSSNSDELVDGLRDSVAPEETLMEIDQDVPKSSQEELVDQDDPSREVKLANAAHEKLSSDLLMHSEESAVKSTVGGQAVEEPVSSEMEAHTEEALDLGEGIIRDLIPVPLLLRGTLRSYQHAGVDWLASLYRNGTNGILADEMGLGKTIQTIALLAHLAEVHEIWETHLVIVPTSVVLNWVTEFQKFLPGFRVLAYYGSLEERQYKRRGWTNDPHHPEQDKRGYNVVVTSYNVAMQDINAFRNVQWHYLVLDEAHNIRNFNSQRWQVLIRLRTKARLLLTGTPLQNDLAEVWALLTFLTAGDDDRSHGELEEFLSHWKDPVKEIFDQGVQKISQNAQRVVDQLHISLRPFLLRRKKSEVEKDLPKKTESVVVCKLSKRQRQLYQDYMGLAETKATLAKGSGVQAGAVLLSLRKVCNHPDLFDPRPIQTSFAMDTSPLEGYSAKEHLIRQLLGESAALSENLIVVGHECKRRGLAQRARNLSASKILTRQLQDSEAGSIEANFDPSTLSGSRALQRHRQRERKLQQLRSSIQSTETSLAGMPLYGADLREIVSINRNAAYSFTPRRGATHDKSLRQWPPLGHRPLMLEHSGDIHLIQTTRLWEGIATLNSYAAALQDTIVRFTFVPPLATAPVIDYAIPRGMQSMLRSSMAYPVECDWGHEARVRSSIAFPDSRLLIYDSGKLQRLVYLLRELQSRGSRTLIFTQMTGTLNILEQFLNLLNLPYLRLDGGTPIERRQLYSAEFNRPDSKYQCMILSSRAGGVGLNLTGASSVVFYDLDWNPQMDRQCMDRAHRIGQFRDVEVYKMVSEKTVEENILRRANQKSLLDETVIQQGQFTTEYQRNRTRGDDNPQSEDEVAIAINRFLGNEDKTNTRALESVEDAEDVQAAQQAAKEDRQDDVDFAERSSKGPSKANTPGPGMADDEESDGIAEERKGHVDLYMIKQMEFLLKDWRYVPAPVRRLDKHGRDPSHRPKRKR